MPSDNPERTDEDWLHVGPWLPEYLADSLESARARELEAHVLVCDTCFAGLLVEHMCSDLTLCAPTPA